jgi:hypothetical protein
VSASLSIRRVDKRRLTQLIRQLPGAADDALNAAAQEALAQIVLSFGKSPSAPGSPPGVDTGTLRGSMRVEKTGDLEYQVMDGVEYGVYLELGTARMAARPFVTPVIETMRQGELGRMMRRYLEDTGVW